MPAESQLLYFHLVLRADDDGVVESYPVMRLLGIASDNFKILLAKGFINQINEEQIIVIMDWREHNRIRSDRKVDSFYLPLLKKQYPDFPIYEATARADRGNKNTGKIGRPIKGTEMGRHKLSKDKLSKGNIKIYVDLFNKLTDGKYIVTAGREQKLNSRLKKYTMEQIQTALENIVRSKWHMGENDRGWKIDPDFLIRNDEQIDKWLNYKPGKEKSTGDFDRILKQMNL